MAVYPHQKAGGVGSESLPAPQEGHRSVLVAGGAACSVSRAGRSANRQRSATVARPPCKREVVGSIPAAGFRTRAQVGRANYPPDSHRRARVRMG